MSVVQHLVVYILHFFFYDLDKTELDIYDVIKYCAASRKTNPGLGSIVKVNPHIFDCCNRRNEAGIILYSKF